jgi:hypothetical protein
VQIFSKPTLNIALDFTAPVETPPISGVSYWSDFEKKKVDFAKTVLYNKD